MVILQNFDVSGPWFISELCSVWDYLLDKLKIKLFWWNWFFHIYGWNYEKIHSFLWFCDHSSKTIRLRGINLVLNQRVLKRLNNISIQRHVSYHYRFHNLDFLQITPKISKFQSPKSPFIKKVTGVKVS